MNDNAWAFAATAQRVKELRSFRTAATQVLDAVQGYISAQLHSTSLAALMQEIRVRSLAAVPHLLAFECDKAGCGLELGDGHAGQQGSGGSARRRFWLPRSRSARMLAGRRHATLSSASRSSPASHQRLPRCNAACPVSPLLYC